MNEFEKFIDYLILHCQGRLEQSLQSACQSQRPEILPTRKPYLW